MIREGRKVPSDVTAKVPEIIERVSKDTEIVALYVFGSLATGDLKPLSDLDFGILVNKQLDKEKRFAKHLDLIGLFTKTFRTEEIDLVVMNDAPLRFSYHIIKSGRLLHCADFTELSEFVEKAVKLYLDFKFFRDRFDEAFLEGVGYYG